MGRGGPGLIRRGSSRMDELGISSYREDIRLFAISSLLFPRVCGYAPSFAQGFSHMHPVYFPRVIQLLSRWYSASG